MQRSEAASDLVRLRRWSRPMWRTLKADRFSQPADRFALAAMTTWMLEFVVERRDTVLISNKRVRSTV
jgi:hypothetical protein